MAEADLDGFGVGTGGDEEAGAGVAEIVDSEALGESGPFNGRVPDLPPELLLRSGAPSGEVNTSASVSSGTCWSRCSLRRSRRNPGMPTIRLRWFLVGPK